METSTQNQLREAIAGIEFRDTDAFIDEIPAAYKPIDRVMADAASLGRVRHTLRLVVNVKGTEGSVAGISDSGSRAPVHARATLRSEPQSEFISRSRTGVHSCQRRQDRSGRGSGENTGKGHRIGQQKNRYQQKNLLTNLFDLFDGSGNNLRSKKSKGKYKGVETRTAKKPPRCKRR